MPDDRNLTQSLLALTAKAAISAACRDAEAYTRLRGGSQEEADIAALRLAKFVTMKPKGRAAEYLENFILGGGDKRFELKQLMNEDSGARSRIELELLRKIPPLKTNMTSPDATNPKARVGSERPQWSVDPCITIFQKNYADQDWWYSLGTFNIDWKIIQFDGKFHFIKLTGKNEYKWHPEQNRITQCLHAAGARLHAAGIKRDLQRNFTIHADPCVIVLSENKRKLIESISYRSFNYDQGKALISVTGIK